MLTWMQKTLHPAWYQGENEPTPYFEGWYFKLVDPTEAHRYAVIAAVFKTEAEDTPHAFVQVNDNVSGKMTYARYPLDAFRAAQDRFAVHIGPNFFSEEAIRLNLRTGEMRMQGALRFHEIKPWPATLTAPGAMGWYAWVPRMECYQGVVSFDHAIEGVLEIDGDSVDFTGGRGYIEKTWGQSFPSAWIWLQSNHFASPETSLFGAISMIPWIGRTFRGFMAGLLHQGTLYRFTTYTGAETEHLAVAPEQIEWVLRDRLYRLEIVADRGETIDLRGPSKVDMGVRVPEALNAAVDVRLSTRKGNHVIFEGNGRNAGLEVVGDLETLLRET